MENLDYAVIGNCLSAALVSKTGAMEWACLPDFNSHAVFAALLDPSRGGQFSINPKGDYRIEQHYIANTNIVTTTFTSGRNCFRVHDFMPRYYINHGGHYFPPDIVRYIQLVKGAPRVVIDYNPRLCYGEHDTVTEIHHDTIKSFTTQGTYESVYLYTDLPFEQVVEKSEITLKKDHFFCLAYNQKIIPPNLERVVLDFEKTRVYWLDWSARTPKYAKYNSEILRSALVLKLLSFYKTGAILAAVTTSLPETIGEVRNWDYRYCWLRDASMIIEIMTRLGHEHVARRFFDFILDIIPFKDKKIQVMYGIRGERDLQERQLDFLAGYELSQPVRIGNAAYRQKQNDIYGVLVDAIHKDLLIFSCDLEKSEHLWTVVRTLLRHVENNWRKADRGIWEFRRIHRHFVFSKVLCWVAADRGSKIACNLGKKEYAEQWRCLADGIKADILRKGWSEAAGAFTQHYGSRDLDAANLLMETYGFISADDPHYIATVERTYEQLCEDGLMFRYRSRDDFGCPTSSFTVCTFWMIKSLFRIGREKLARDMFENVLSHANHVGLLSEDIDIQTKRLLGNFPQGYSHLALIDTAMTLGSTRLDDNDRLYNIYCSKCGS